MGCGGSGSSGSAGTELDGQASIQGSITSESGGQGDLSGWNICLFDKDYGICRTATIDSAGLYSFRGVDISRNYTLVLLSPALVFQSILAVPVTDRTGYLYQYFKISAKNLPRVIQKGSVLTFQNISGLSWDKSVIKDSDSDELPDGITGTQFGLSPGFVPSTQSSSETRFLSAENPDFDKNSDRADLSSVSSSVSSSDSGQREIDGFSPRSSLSFLLTSSVDTDRDGIANVKDMDIDGDGIPNVFDADDDGDGLLDIFDLDSDGDQNQDRTALTGDGYFPAGVEWIAAKYSLAKQDDNTTKKILTVVAKLRTGVSPDAVQIRGPINLLKNATLESKSANGETTATAFDGLLMDDGKSGDGAANDGLFSRTITLPSTAVLVRNMVILVQLRFGNDANATFIEFPYTFAPISIGTVTALHAGSTSLGSFQCCSGSPFGASVTDYSWTVKIYDSSDQLVYSSPSQAGEAAPTTFTVPSGIWENITGLAANGETFQFKISASLYDRIPGYASYNITTKKESLTTGY